MFKWVCLLVAVVALAGLGWVINDLRLEAKRAADTVNERLPKLFTNADKTMHMIDERLPRILDKTDRLVVALDQHLPQLLTRTTTLAQALDQRLPQILTRMDKITQEVGTNLPAAVAQTKQIADTLSTLAADIREYREIWTGVHAVTRDASVVHYANSVLNFLDGQDAKIGLKKKGSGDELKSAVPAKEWVAGARKKAAFLTVVAKDRKDLLDRLSKNKFGSPWQIQVKGQPPLPLHDYLKAHHEESKKL